MSEPTRDRPADIHLASASPRRRELLERLGVSLAVVPTQIDESPRPDEPPADYVRRMAAEKLAAALAAGAPAELPVIAADTTVIVDGAILGNPSGPEEARAMLERLAGRRHQVITAYKIRLGAKEMERAVTTLVSFRLLDPGEIEAYVACGEWRGKAGGYAIQGVAGAFVGEIRGSLTNVIGLPLAEVLADLRALGALPQYPPARFPVAA